MENITSCIYWHCAVAVLILIDWNIFIGTRLLVGGKFFSVSVLISPCKDINDLIQGSQVLQSGFRVSNIMKSPIKCNEEGQLNQLIFETYFNFIQPKLLKSTNYNCEVRHIYQEEFITYNNTYGLMMSCGFESHMIHLFVHRWLVDSRLSGSTNRNASISESIYSNRYCVD